MRKKKFIAVVLSVIMLIGVLAPCAFATKTEDAKLKFNSDGKFKIVQFSDIHMGKLKSQRDCVIDYLNEAMNTLKPDLVVLTGDNVSGYDVKNMDDAEKFIRCFMDVFEKYGVPVAYVNGNHDDECDGTTKRQELAIFDTYKCSIAYDEGESEFACPNYNVPIYSSDGKKVAFNIWMVDSNNWQESDQEQWYLSKSAELERENGGKVPSLMFQHIVVPELIDYLVETDEISFKNIEYNGKRYALPQGAKGVLGEKPCPESKDAGELATVQARSDCLAIVNGHDHLNTYDIDADGVRLIGTPITGYGSYGLSSTRGARVFELDEKNPKEFNTYFYLTKTASKNYSAVGKIRYFFVSGSLDFVNIFQYVKNIFRQIFKK